MITSCFIEHRLCRKLSNPRCMHAATTSYMSMHMTWTIIKWRQLSKSAPNQPGPRLRVHVFILQRWCHREGPWVEVGPQQRCCSPSPRFTYYTNTEGEAWRPTPNAAMKTMNCALRAQWRRCPYVSIAYCSFGKEREISLRRGCHLCPASMVFTGDESGEVRVAKWKPAIGAEAQVWIS
jgi:hypothetical protein